MVEPTRDEISRQYSEALRIIDELRAERDTAREYVEPLERLMQWLNFRVADHLSDPAATVDRAIELLPEACGDDHHVGDKPDDCYACLAWNTKIDLDWLHKLLNIRVGKARQHGNVNRWTCETCGAQIWSVDVDEGVTPMIILCRAKGCGGEAVSACYNVGPPGAAPSRTHRWVRPRSLVGLDPGTRHHVDQGGLILEEIPAAEAPGVEEILSTGSRRETSDVR